MMKNGASLTIIVSCALLLTGCDFMTPQDNGGNVLSGVGDTFDQMIGNFSGTVLDTKIGSGISDDKLSGTRSTVKGYAQEYYNGTMSGYVGKAKEGLSGAMQNLKNQYNSGVDSLTHSINNAISDSVTEKMNTLKM